MIHLPTESQTTFLEFGLVPFCLQSLQDYPISDVAMSEAFSTVEKCWLLGCRCGFLGPLHLEVFLQRLQQEHKAEVISTAPTVPYELELAREAQHQLEQPEHVIIESVADYPKGRKVTPCSSGIFVCVQVCNAILAKFASLLLENSIGTRDRCRKIHLKCSVSCQMRSFEEACIHCLFRWVCVPVRAALMTTSDI